MFCQYSRVVFDFGRTLAMPTIAMSAGAAFGGTATRDRFGVPSKASMMTWALLPPNPKAFSAARRGPALFQGSGV